jgi:hypothetical protein
MGLNWQVYAKWFEQEWRTIGEPTSREQAEAVVAQMRAEIKKGIREKLGDPRWSQWHCVPL